MDGTTLACYGINYDKGLKTCMGNPVFYRKILSMFLQDDCYRRAQAAYADKDFKALFHCMHELKGISGNEGLDALFNAALPLVEHLRHGAGEEAETDRLFAAVETAYHLACEGINRFLAEAQADASTAHNVEFREER